MCAWFVTSRKLKVYQYARGKDFLEISFIGPTVRLGEMLDMLSGTKCPLLGPEVTQIVQA